jgi:hypothetical protein
MLCNSYGGVWADLHAEGDVEGVMDRPIGNTPEVHAECEKWYVNAANYESLSQHLILSPRFLLDA